MKMHRFLLSDLTFSNNQIVIKDKNLLNQILNVFRMKTGFQFILFDGSGTEYLLEISENSKNLKKEIICEIKEEKQGIKRDKRLNLVFSMIKKENTELVLNMGTQLGVTNFIPIISERTIKTGWNFERLNKIVIEATEQSGFSDFPIIPKEPLKLNKFLENLSKEKKVLGGNFDNLAVLDFDGVQLSTIKHLISVDTILVGPEGGWTQKERDLFKKYNIKSISLGNNVLRAETACISAASIFLL